MTITLYFVNRSIRKMMRRAAQRPHCFRMLKDAGNILLFCEAGDEKKLIPCLQQLSALHKSVKVCIGIPAKAPDWKAKDAYFPVYYAKDISHWGYPVSEVANKILRQPADILIDFTRQESTFLKYLVLKHPSTFKIGFKRAGEPDMYDFSIATTEETSLEHSFGQMLYYLQTIRSK